MTPLCGDHLLGGVDIYREERRSEPGEELEDVQVCRLELDCVTWEFRESKYAGVSEGHNGPVVVPEPVVSRFGPIPVTCVCTDGGFYGLGEDVEVLRITSRETGLDVLEVGTYDVSTEYQRWVCEFSLAAVGARPPEEEAAPPRRRGRVLEL